MYFGENYCFLFCDIIKMVKKPKFKKRSDFLIKSRNKRMCMAIAMAVAM